MEPDDLPIPRGLEENITHCTRRGQHLDPERILAQLATHRPLDRIPAPHTEPHFPDLVGGLAVTLARTFTVTAPGLTRPEPPHWETVRTSPTCFCDTRQSGPPNAPHQRARLSVVAAPNCNNTAPPCTDGREPAGRQRWDAHAPWM